MAQQIPHVAYLELGDSPHLVANECTTCRRVTLTAATHALNASTMISKGSNFSGRNLKVVHHRGFRCAWSASTFRSRNY